MIDDYKSKPKTSYVRSSFERECAALRNQLMEALADLPATMGVDALDHIRVDYYSWRHASEFIKTVYIWESFSHD